MKDIIEYTCNCSSTKANMLLPLSFILFSSFPVYFSLFPIGYHITGVQVTRKY
jgi:hypothetical protein